MQGRRTAPSAAAPTGSSAPPPASTPGGQERSAHQLTLTVALPESLLDEVCERLTDLLAEQARTAPSSPWLTLPAAAAYLDCSRDRLYKLTAARAIPFRRRQGGQGILFHRDELDAWVETAYPPDGCAL